MPRHMPVDFEQNPYHTVHAAVRVQAVRPSPLRFRLAMVSLMGAALAALGALI